MSPKVFIASSSEALSVVRQIEEYLGGVCEIFAWDTHPVSPSQYLFEGLLDIAENSDFAILVLTPDDELHYRDGEYSSPRDNVIFEAGLFMSKLGRDRVFLLSPSGKNIKFPTDIAPIQRVIYSDLQNSFEDAIVSIKNRILELGKKPLSLTGKRLFQYKGYYPIDLTRDRKPVFNKSIFLIILS